jgi:hypothetical protein
MKTVNDAAIEYCLEVKGQIHQDFIDDFKAGVEFAQRWYNLSEIKPEVKKYPYKILVGGGKKVVLSAETCTIFSKHDVDTICEMFEFWKPIDIE